MPWPTYSERIMHHSAAGSWQYTVPVGRRAVIKFLSAVSFQTVISVVQVQIKGIACFHQQFPAGGGSVRETFMAVAYGGDVITLYLSHSEMLGHLSGFIFDDPSHATGPSEGASVLPAPPEVDWKPFPEE